MINQQIQNLIEETELFFESFSISDNISRGELKRQASSYATIAGSTFSTIGLAKRPGFDVNNVTVNNVTSPIYTPNSFNIADKLDMGIAAGFGIGAASFGYLIYKYLTSYERYKQKIILLELKLKKDPNNIELKSKLKKFKLKLEEARRRAEIEERSNIEKLKEYKIRLEAMKKENAPKEDIRKLINKIENKQNMLIRVGALLRG